MSLHFFIFFLIIMTLVSNCPDSCLKNILFPNPSCPQTILTLVSKTSCFLFPNSSCFLNPIVLLPALSHPDSCLKSVLHQTIQTLIHLPRHKPKYRFQRFQNET